MVSYLEQYFFIQKVNDLGIMLYDLNLNSLCNLNRNVIEAHGDTHACRSIR